ncbi:hypothetical protein G7046_g1610 [Stylonectria norvegica]|nr:hypothetical protein G7046_g1610 [Stylonectria norvegica]
MTASKQQKTNPEATPVAKEEEPAPVFPDYFTSPDAVLKDDAHWRFGRKPDYSKARKAYEETKEMNHAAGSLHQLVENLVKNWEIEASYKPQSEEWRTVDSTKYRFSVNGGPPLSAADMAKMGTYNALIEPNKYYSPKHNDFAASHKTFKRMMPAFPWEVLDVYSGPPKVAFRWRHWGFMENDYTARNEHNEKVVYKAHKKKIEIKGVTVAELDDQFRILSLDTYFDPQDMFRQMESGDEVEKKAEESGELREVVVGQTKPSTEQEGQCPFMRQNAPQGRATRQHAPNPHQNDSQPLFISPSPTMDSESVVSQVQRKIELQSPEDLTFLVANVRRAATARLNEAFPHVDGNEGEDELRNQIEELVTEYINKTFSLAAPNLSINGLPANSESFLDATSTTAAAEPAYEPFDSRKRRRVADLITQEEKLLEDVAAMKRSVPAAAAALQAEQLKTGLARDDALLEERRTRVVDGAEAAVALDVSPLERQQGVEEGFRRAVDGLGRLKRDMPAVVARMERARVAGAYVVTQGR